MANKKCKCCETLDKLHGSAFCGYCGGKVLTGGNGHKRRGETCEMPGSICDPQIGFVKLIVRQAKGV